MYIGISCAGVCLYVFFLWWPANPPAKLSGLPSAHRTKEHGVRPSLHIARTILFHGHSCRRTTDHDVAPSLHIAPSILLSSRHCTSHDRSCLPVVLAHRTIDHVPRPYLHIARSILFPGRPCTLPFSHGVCPSLHIAWSLPDIL